MVYEVRWTGQNERAAAISISSLYLQSCPGEIETGDREREERRGGKAEIKELSISSLCLPSCPGKIETGDRDRDERATAYEDGGRAGIEEVEAISISSLYLRSCPGPDGEGMGRDGDGR
jgi:hypothetical protein